MPTPINSSSTSQDSYRAQAANNQAGKQIASLASSLKASEKIAKAVGADTTGLQNALQRVSGNQEQANASTKVSLSSEGVEKLRAERATPAASQSTAAVTARPEKKQFGSVDEAIAYGASRAAEQANARATDKTTKPNEVSAVASNSQVASTNRPERKQFSSVDEAISYGASRAAEQANTRPTDTSNKPSETSKANSQTEAASTTTRPERRQFKSVDEAITYGAQRAVEQYSKQQLALGSATRGNA